MRSGPQPGLSTFDETGSRARGRVACALLATLWLGLLIAASTFDRGRWPSMVGDESTYLMTAESLAWDADLLYSRADFERFVAHWGLPPEGLILQSGDAGRRITFGKPFFYPLLMAPLVRLSPTRGPFVTNALLLGLAALMASRALRRPLGAAAPLWVIAFCFASVTFAYTFWAHSDLFLLALSATALSLVYRQDEEPPEGMRSISYRPPGRWGPLVRWAVAGGLLALVVFSRPLYLPLLLAPLAALPRGRRARSAAALLGGALLVALLAAVVHRVNADAWTSYGAQRRGFYSSTGYPEIDFPAREWSRAVEDLGDASWAEARRPWSPPPTDAALWRWNSLYFIAGRHVGVLPYFLPVVLGLLGAPRGVRQWVLLLAVLACVGAFFLYRPFNFYGGGGTIANRYFMPLFPAFWFLGPRPARPGLALLGVSLAAAVFMWPLWVAPRAYPLRSNHTYRYVSPAANRWLPYETTQSHLKPGGRSDVVHQGLWIKFLSPTLREKRDASALLLDRGGRGELLIGVNAPLAALELQTRGPPAERIEVVGGATVASEREQPDGRVLTLELGRPRARHPMWWTWQPVVLYQLGLASESSADGRVTFTLRRVPDPTTGAPPV